jgi:hypothetical protein
MAHVFTSFERWALSLPVESFGLPALHDPTYLELIERADTIGFTGAWKREGDKGLAAIYTKLLGSNDYLEELCSTRK